jgi:aminoglycoside N3'-acetyltransferase
VLLFGVTTESYTLFHTAEDAAGVPYLYLPQPCRVRMDDGLGHQKDLLFRRHYMRFTRRFEEIGPWLEALGLLKRMNLGLSSLTYIPSSAAVHEAVLKEVRRNPLFLLKPESASQFGKTGRSS